MKNIFPRKLIRLSGGIIIIYWASSDTPQLGLFSERNTRRVIIKTQTYNSAASVSGGREAGEDRDEGRGQDHLKHSVRNVTESISTSPR